MYPNLSSLSEKLDRRRPSVLMSRVRKRLTVRAERAQLALARNGRDVCWLESEGDAQPLVTVRIATYNRGPLVAERAIASALAQTYDNIEVLVVGDACDEATAEAVRSVRDERVRFVNLPRRGLYPERATHRWMVAGADPMNAALFLARGTWLAPCDDDDELTPDHVEVLLRSAKSRRLEMVYGQALSEVEPDTWRPVGEWPPRIGCISHGAVFYSLGLRFMTHDVTAWQSREPGDWNMWSRMLRTGVRMGYEPKVVYRHYLEAGRRAGQAAGA